MATRFGDFIFEQRQVWNIYLNELAQQTGLTVEYLKAVEDGQRKPRSDKVLRKLAKALHCELDKLYFLLGMYPPRIRALDWEQVKPAIDKIKVKK